MQRDGFQTPKPSKTFISWAHNGCPLKHQRNGESPSHYHLYRWYCDHSQSWVVYYHCFTNIKIYMRFPPPPLKGVGGTGALAHLFMTNSEDYYHGYTHQNHNNCASLGSSASLGAPITHSRSFRSLACIAELCSAVLCSTLLFSTLLCSAHWI